MAEEIRKSDAELNSSKPLSDSELALLLSDSIDSKERAILLERLEKNPDDAEILALAASKVDTSGTFSDEVLTEKLMGRVEKAFDVGDVCEICGGELVRDGKYCPQCGVETNKVIKCMKCGKGISEDVYMCPHCGVELKRSQNNRQKLLIFMRLIVGGGLIGSGLMIQIWSGFTWIAFLLEIVGILILFGIVYPGLRGESRGSSKVEDKSEEEERRIRKKKSG